MEHAKHIIRAVLLLVVITIAFIFVRHFAIPESFGEHGHYRAASVVEFSSQPPAHGGPGACRECHDEEWETRAEGVHKTITCETCHAPLATHVVDDAKIADMQIHRSYKLCAYCHQRLVARPKEFPQVNIADHLAENSVEMSDEICLECHDAHSPGE